MSVVVREPAVEFLPNKKKKELPDIAVKVSKGNNWKVRQRLLGMACLILCFFTCLLGDGSILLFLLPSGIALLFSKQEIK